MTTLNKTPEMKFVKKGWGHELWIVNKEEYCGKLTWPEITTPHRTILDDTIYIGIPIMLAGNEA